VNGIVRMAGAALALLLGGCAYAPGMYLGHTSAHEDEAAPAVADIVPVPLDWALIRRLDAAPRPAPPVVPQTQPRAYRIGAGDALRITVWNHPDLNFAPNLSVTAQTVAGGTAGQANNVVPLRVVAHDGTIHFPMIGAIEAAGCTVPELRQRIADRLSHYVKDPQVEVEIGAYRSQRVFVVGEVKAPGNFAISDVPMHVADAIGQAGGTTTNADLSVVVVSRGNERYTLDLDRLYYEGEMTQNLLLRDGDVVTVPDRHERRIFVLGEVVQPKSYPLPRGRLTLADAVADAGGPNPFSSNAGQVFVLRLSVDGEPLVYHLDAHSPAALLLADRFVLHARDVVYVDPTQLARIGRVLAQVLPWLQGARTTQQIAE